VSVNDWSLSDAWSALFDLTWSADATAWTEPDAGRFAPDARGMWAQKMGNTPEQWEDAFASEPAAGVAAVADGASTGIYCRTWADELARRFVADRPDVRDPLVLGKWVHGLRMEWRSAIEYEKLNWSKQRKVDEVGAAATLLGLEVGPADAEGNYPWRACAVGDASLFWVRDGKLVGTFPVVAADQFGSAPLLVRSNPGHKTLALAAAGVCRPGDRFLLATDAVAARLFKSAANGPGPEWERFETIGEDEWRAELDTLRKSNDMVNDDCTLLALRVVGGSSVVGGRELEVGGQLGSRELVAGGQESDRVGEIIPDPLLPLPVSRPISDTQRPPTNDQPTTDVPADGERTPTRDGFSDPTDNPV
jgi:hypothetical protein